MPDSRFSLPWLDQGYHPSEGGFLNRSARVLTHLRHLDRSPTLALHRYLVIPRRWDSCVPLPWIHTSLRGNTHLPWVAWGLQLLHARRSNDLRYIQQMEVSQNSDVDMATSSLRVSNLILLHLFQDHWYILVISMLASWSCRYFSLIYPRGDLLFRRVR